MADHGERHQARVRSDVVEWDVLLDMSVVRQILASGPLQKAPSCYAEAICVDVAGNAHFLYRRKYSWYRCVTAPREWIGLILYRHGPHASSQVQA